MTRPIPVPLTSEEPVASVLRILSLREVENDTFTAYSLPQVRRVYGGQVVAQALLAAAATLEHPSRVAHSLHASFLRGGNPENAFTLAVQRIREGRSFTSRFVRAFQDEREILTMSASFAPPENGLEFVVPAPKVPEPEGLRSAIEIFRAMDHPVGRFLGKTASFDVRHVENNLYTGSDPARAHIQHLWMRPRASMPPALSQHIHRALLAYVVDQVMFEPAMRVLGLSWMTPGMSAASLDHSMWFHRDVDMNQWLLYEGTCFNVNSGRTLTRTRIFTREGILVAEAEQQGMLRIPTEEHQGSDRWGFGVDSRGQVSVGMA
ncbi:acyl-CoA thioesterase [Schaalia sp. lx-260]|uniref:acyl-CoA thioesterase n=1 Tax=Schaalia sp. lx-260 TaxID=2899082 RepID=UPI001E33FDE9|nr:acyl-CoA thioesterase domain-containing protein [Schaalia sp. lx-260]MCD4549529.1 thioesterase family protein [Schaalia sp. lx-260]